MSLSKCIGITKQGKPCQQPAIGSDRLCFFHSQDPAIVAQRVVARRLRGRRVAISFFNKEMVKRIEELFFEELFNALIKAKLRQSKKPQPCSQVDAKES